MIAAVVQVSKLVWKLKTLRLSHSPTPAFGWALSLCNVFSFPSHKARVVICSYVRASVRGMVSADVDVVLNVRWARKRLAHHSPSSSPSLPWRSMICLLVDVIFTNH